MGATDSGRPRPPRLVSVFCAGVITTGVVLWTFTSVELPLPNGKRAMCLRHWLRAWYLMLLAGSQRLFYAII